MPTTLELPLPQLVKGRFAFDDSESGYIEALWDPGLYRAQGVYAAFTLRGGGVSRAPYDGLNLGTHVGDDPTAVAENRRRVQAAFGALGDSLLVPNQVHGDCVQAIDDASPEALESACAAMAEGADALVVSISEAAALLCFADCVPLIMVAPGGSFAVVHAGWRGVDNRIAVKALYRLMEQAGLADAASINIYRGPYIRSECFETGSDLHRRFAEGFGAAAVLDASHVDLGAALDISLMDAGVDSRRIADAGLCTMCHNQDWFSYRAQGGVCGRHGAFAVRHNA